MGLNLLTISVLTNGGEKGVDINPMNLKVKYSPLCIETFLISTILWRMKTS